MTKEFYSHETAIVDAGAKIGNGTRIWHWTHVSSTATIGASCSLGQNVYVADGVQIGCYVKIQNNVSIYEGVEIEDDVFCGPSIVFTNVYNPRSAFSRKLEYKKTKVSKGATLGANCTIVCGVTIGQYAFIGAGAVVNRDVPDFALVLGVPGKQSAWMSRFGERLHLPITGNGTDVCPHTGDQYILEEGCLRLRINEKVK